MKNSEITKALFYKFLKDNKILNQFLINCYMQNRGTRKNTFLFSKIYRNELPAMYLDLFIWTHTSEGFDFWEDLAIKWDTHLKGFVTKLKGASRPKKRNICKLYGIQM